MICSFCKHEFDRPNKEYKDICIDGYSKEHLFEHLDQIFEMCPNCGILLEDLTEFANDKTGQDIARNAFLNCTKYQDLLADKSIDKLEKKLLLGKIVYDELDTYNGKHNNDMHLTLFTYYHAKGIDKKAIMHLKEKETIVNHILDGRKNQYNVDIITHEVLHGLTTYVLQVADMYRQLGDFDTALKYLDIFDAYKFDKYNRSIKAKVKLQKKLCSNKDTNRVVNPIAFDAKKWAV